MDNVIGKIPGDIQIDHFFFHEMAVLHAAFFHHSPGSVVSGEKGSVDGMKALLPEQKCQEAMNGLRRIAPVPVPGADPVSDLAGAVLLIEEIDDPDEAPGLLQADCEQILPPWLGGKVEFLHRFRISANKGFQHFFVVGDVDIIVLFIRFSD